MKELFELFTRLVIAVEKIAANGGGGFVAEKAEKAEGKKTEGKKTESKKTEEPKTEPEKKADPFADDEPEITKEQVRKALTDYANATDNEKALAELAANTSNKAGKIGDIKPEDYPAVFKAISKLLAATKK